MSHHYSMQSQFLSSSSSSLLLLTDRSNITHSNTDLIMGNTVPSSFLEMNLTQTTNDDNSQCKSPLWIPPVTPYTLLGLLKPHLTQSSLLVNNNTTHQIQQQTSNGTIINTKLCEDSIGHQPFQQQQSSLKQSQQQISSMSAYLSELLNQSQTTITTTTSGKNSVHGEFKLFYCYSIYLY
uniref:Uncharacterized protein n=1 Tax=Schistosoma haematobium TaxID=6185 RepID=A0A094ZJT6_SCHHA